MSASSSVTIIIPGQLDFLRLVDKVSDAVTAYAGFAVGERDAISIAIIEACTNAIQHGCCCDQAKAVTVTYSMEGDDLKVTVVDPGAGFDPEGLKCDIGNGVEERGRGFAIIKALMDDVQYDFTNGTSITMVKHLGAAREETGT
ncbi:MAG: ATP-binding protein [Candidatus Eisenbacteria bacterium]|nr:ATP-binding protein [Candidatus Eisenbacteria bacterium]